MFDIDRMAGNWRELQEGCNFAARLSHAPNVAQQISEFARKAGFVPASLDGSQFSAAFEELEENGYSRLGLVLDTSTVTEIVNYFRSRPCYNAHVVNRGTEEPNNDGIGRWVGQGAEEHAFGSYPLHDIMDAPKLLELFNDPHFLAAAERYLGCVPTIYSINAWWSFPLGLEEQFMTQAFHRDCDDFRYFSLFIYLTDVSESFGPHQYVAGTHKPDQFTSMLIATLAPDVDSAKVDKIPAFNKLAELMTNGPCYVGDDRIMDLFGENLETICASAGSAFLADPSGFHRAMHPTAGPRLMFWARYGLYPNLGSLWHNMKPVQDIDIHSRVGTDTKSRYINRLLVDFLSGQGSET